MKQLNYKIAFGIALALGSLNTFANGPAFVDDVSITTANPDLLLLDSDAAGTDWEICVDNGCNYQGGPAEAFNINMRNGGVSSTDRRPFTIQTGARTDALRLNGNNVGMGTATPGEELHIFSPGFTISNPPFNFYVAGQPSIRLESQTTLAGSSKLWDINGRSAFFAVEDASASTTPFKVEGNALTDSLVVDTTGNIGLGTASPESSLHIKKADANVLIESTAAAPVAIVLDLEHNGIPAFRLNNTAINNKWAFAAQSDQSFTLSKAGSGATEMKIKANGDVEASGDVYAKGVMLTSSRAAKTDIEPIKATEVMEKLKQVEVAEWRYKTSDKNDRHISPMAEDFYSLFNLGPSDKFINPNDLASVAIIAAKELQKKSEVTSADTVALKAETLALKAENISLKEQGMQLNAKNDELYKRLSSLEKLVTNLASGEGLLPNNGDKVVLKK